MHAKKFRNASFVHDINRHSKYLKTSFRCKNGGGKREISKIFVSVSVYFFCFEDDWTPGKYTIIKKTFGSATEDKNSARKSGFEIGSQVTVVEVVEVPEQNRIRGKLANGSWISLTNTSNGNDFVKKVEELAGVRS